MSNPRRQLKVSVVVASLPHKNLGMISVNEAFDSWSSRCGPEVEVSYYQYGKRYVWSEHSAHELKGKLGEMIHADRIVYWGDFLHMDHYHQGLKGATLYADSASGIDDVRDHLLLASADIEVVSKSILIGGTLALNSASEYAEVAYEGALRRMISNARGTLFRDPYSAYLAGVYRMSGDSAGVGCDCAFLLDPNDLDDFEAPDVQEPIASIFFGRHVEGPESAAFVSKLCRKLGVRPRWLHWLPPRKSDITRKWFWMRKSGLVQDDSPEDISLGRALTQLASSRLVITDTYHMAVNAWNLGIPAVCIANVFEDVNRSVNSGRRFAWRDKRHAMYSMIDALPYFVHGWEMRFGRSRTARLEQLTRLLSAGTKAPEYQVSMERLALIRKATSDRLRRLLAQD